MKLEKLSDDNSNFLINRISKILLHEKTGISEALLEDIQKVMKKYMNVDKAVIYGSRAKGNYKYNSDIDIVTRCQAL